MTTNAFVVKAAVIEALRRRTGPGDLLADVDVQYTYSAGMGARAIYGGGVRFEHADLTAERFGGLVTEEARCSLYVRVVDRIDRDVAGTDAQAAAIGAAMAAALLSAAASTDAALAAVRFTRIASGMGDYEITDDEAISIVAYELVARSTINYSG